MIVVNARFLTQKITGVQRFAIEISKELRKIDKSILFVAPKGIIHKALAEELSVNIIGTKTGHLWEKLELPFFLNSKKKPLLVNLCNSAPLFYGNQVVTMHDVAVYENPLWFSKNFVRLYKLMSPIIARSSKKLITVSEFSKKEIVKYLKVEPSKIEVVYNSVTDFNSIEVVKNSYKDDYVLCVGSVEPRKNLTNTILAFERADLPVNYKLVIVGGQNKLFNKLNFTKVLSENSLSRIKFTGFISDEELKLLYKNAKVFLYPSLYEGFGIPPLEAMLYGCPTIVSNVASLPEICGDASLYVNPNDIDDIANVLSYLINSSNETQKVLVDRGKIQIKKYSWEKSAEKMYSIIQNQLK